MERANNRIKQENNKTNVGGDAHIDPLFVEITKSNNAITLVTLVITIVVMLILVGVTVSINIDEGDLFDKAENATAQWNNRITTEDNVMQNLLTKRNELLGGTTTPETPTTPPGETPADPMPEVTLSPTTGEIEVGARLVLTASLNVTPTQNIVWTSSDDTIATVAGSGEKNVTGTVTGVKAGGTVTITATYGNKKANCSVTVTPAMISFTIEGVQYQAERGTNWYTWCNSSYDLNDDFSCIDEENFVHGSAGSLQSVHYMNKAVIGTDEIVEGAKYNIVVSGTEPA